MRYDNEILMRFYFLLMCVVFFLYCSNNPVNSLIYAYKWERN